MFSVLPQSDGNGTNNLNNHNVQNHSDEQTSTTREEINPSEPRRLDGIILLKLIYIYFRYSQHVLPFSYISISH